jgi:sulfur-carrier protein
VKLGTHRRAIHHIIAQCPGSPSPANARFTSTRGVESSATTLREALEAAFAVNPQLRGYVLDDQGHLRANVVAFIDGRRCRDRIALNDPLRADGRIHVLQAQSGE